MLSRFKHFDSPMTMKQVLKQSGVEETFRFSSLTSNWPTALRRAKLMGLRGVPVRIGAKRVVIAIDSRPAPKRRHHLPLLFLTAVFVTGVAFSVLPKEAVPVQQEIDSSCIAITVGDSLHDRNSVTQIRDWLVTISDESSLGNIQQVSISAKCHERVFEGTALLAKRSNDVVIKKLTPTKR